MKSFRHYIREQSPQEDELPIYRLSGKPHLPFIPVFDSKGNEHRATFHSELKDGKVRYDFTEAGRAAKANGAFLRIGDLGVGEKELEFHHLRPFKGDVFSDFAGMNNRRGGLVTGVQIMTYTPQGRADKEPPADPREPRLKKGRRLGPPVPGGRRSTLRRTTIKR